MGWLKRLLASSWLPHAGILAAALAWLAAGTPAPPSVARALLNSGIVMTLLLGGGVALLALLYQRANTALQALVVVAAYLWVAFGPALTGIGTQTAAASAALLLPPNLLALALLDERGLLSPAGLLRLLILGGQGAAVAALAYGLPQGVAAITQASFLPPLLSAWTTLPEQALVLVPLTTTTLLVIAWTELSPPVLGTFSALLTTTAGLDLTGPPEQAAVATTALVLLALVSLLLATLQEAYRLAFRDGLTGLPNRRALDALLARLGGRYAIAMMDVDHFKGFNDTYGHEVGDQVLRRVARFVERAGGGGQPFRYGGEEFAIVFPGQDAEAVKGHLEALRAAVAEAPFRVRGAQRPKDDQKGERQRGSGDAQSVQITISIGVAAPQERGTPASEVVEAADQALYRAKRGGRNRVAT